MIGIGIDTGGTCTDAVIFDTKSHKVLSQSKTLTTRQDLKVGILRALGGLDQDLARNASYISLSTTLATNACVEHKGGRAKLVFIGVNPQVVKKMGGEYGLPPMGDTKSTFLRPNSPIVIVPPILSSSYRGWLPGRPGSHRFSPKFSRNAGVPAHASPPLRPTTAILSEPLP